MTSNFDHARRIISQSGLSVSSQSERCPDCGAMVPQVPDGPTHAYFGASPGCWALYTTMLEHEYASRDERTHQLSVDTYAVQHPGTSTRKAAINSVGIHLASLCLALEQGMPVEQLPRLRASLSKNHRIGIPRLEPPRSSYPMTLTDLVDATSAEDYSARVQRWAETTWNA